MTPGELIGWAAAALTLLTFSMRSMTNLRLVAVVASLCFIVYGAAQALYPVVALHCLLLPCNLYRLLELLRRNRRQRTAAGAAPLRKSGLKARALSCSDRCIT